MKICIVTHKVLEGDGQGKVNYEVVKESLNLGHQVTLVASKIDKELDQNKLVRWVHIPVKSLPTAFLKNLFFSQQAAQWLRKHHTEFDIVKINGAITNFHSHINAVHFVHSSWLNSPAHTWKQKKNLYGLYQFFYTAINSHWEKQVFACSKVIVAVSEKVKRELIEIGISPEKIAVIINGVDTEEFAPGNSDLTSLGLPEDVLLAFFAGDIRTPRKNLDTVLKALVEVPDLHLAVVGSIQNSPYPKMAEDLGVSKRVHFLGYRLDVSQIMQSVDMFVFPSRYEPFGMVISEAMATGLPVITTSVTGAAEIVTPECGIVLSDSEDVYGLAKALKKLSSDRALREQMGKVGRTIAEQHSWKSKAERYLELFEELIAS